EHRIRFQEGDLEQQTIAVFVIRRGGGGAQEPPEDVGIVIEGVTVLHERLIYVFEVLQKIIMQLEQQKMSPKVQNLCVRL
uniref:Uncharacterized protein n=1 Tax=Astyanax mexicanus TaxID=7994 RepID=A0A3B1JV88_ASTMX